MKKAVYNVVVILMGLVSAVILLPYFLDRGHVNLETKQVRENFEVQIESINTEDTEVFELDHGNVCCRLIIPEIDLDYYVYTNDVDNYYLHKDSEGNDSKRGEIYTNNYGEQMILWGHRMIDNSMFGRLDELYAGCSLSITDMIYSDTKTANYEVVDYMAVGADEVYEYLASVDYDVALVTCNPTHDKGRLVVICKEVN